MFLVLRPPTMSDEPVLRRMDTQLRADGFVFLPEHTDWPDLLARLAREARGVDLEPGRVRCDFLIAEVAGRPVGRVSIRHELNEYLLNVGGHVGYAVAPEFRRRGHATEMLRQSVSRLAGLGVEQVLVTCDETNIASRRTIERCGGVLEDIRQLPDRTLCHYWITGGSPPQAP